MKIIIGIDPGKNGGLCFIKDGKIIQLIKMPESNKAIYDLLYPYGKLGAVCFLEQVHAMPGQGVTSMFSFGQGYGALQMALIATKISTISVTPQRWQKYYGFGSRNGMSTTEWKKKLQQRAEQIFPTKKIHVSVADSVLIAHYGDKI